VIEPRRPDGRRRDFISATRIEADRYDLQVDEGAADDAVRLLAAMPACQWPPAVMTWILLVMPSTRGSPETASNAALLSACA
jgi:hypothetical protein